MPEVIVRAGRASEVVHPERRTALEDLAARVAGDTHTVTLEIVEYVPGRRGLSWPQAVWLFVGGPVAGTVLTKMTEDLYETAKRWCREQWARNRQESASPRPQSFTILGPDGEVLRSWRVDKSGECDL